MQLTVLLPAYHEEGIIGRVVTRIRGLYPDQSQAEVLVVDDGSADGTGAAAEKAGARVVRHPYNKGNGAAIKTGIRAAGRNAEGGDIALSGDGRGGAHGVEEDLRAADEMV